MDSVRTCIVCCPLSNEIWVYHTLILGSRQIVDRFNQLPYRATIVAMPAQETLVSVAEYLNTGYEGPDREYVDGRIVERNVGERSHSLPQKRLVLFFGPLESGRCIYAYPEQRVQVKATRFRVPDVCVYVGTDPKEEVFRTPPFLAIEILSKDDRASDLQEKLDDYLAFGIRFVWVIDPRTTRGYTYSLEDGFETVRPLLFTKSPEIELPVERLFE